MPLIYMHYPTGTFSEHALNSVAEEITTLGLECEKLPNSPFVRSTAWIYANQYPRASVFVGGRPRTLTPRDTNVVSIQINVFEGGLDDNAKQTLIKRTTEIVGTYANFAPARPLPVYVVIHEIAPANFGVFGERITLDAFRHPPADAEPL